MDAKYLIKNKQSDLQELFIYDISSHPNQLSISPLPKQLSISPRPNQLSISHLPKQLSISHLPKQLSISHLPKQLSISHNKFRCRGCKKPYVFSTGRLKHESICKELKEDLMAAFVLWKLYNCKTDSYDSNTIFIS